MRKKKFLSLALAVCFAVSSVPPIGTFAADGATTGEADDGYKLVWSDEFSGTELNRDDWNVELHDPGWVNSELQAYVGSEDNIQVKDDKLYIYPKKEETETEGLESMVDDSLNKEYDATAVTTNLWDVQGVCEGLTIEEGATYYVSFDAVSTGERSIGVGVQNRVDYDPTYVEVSPTVTEEKQNFWFSFTAPATDTKAGLFFNMGRTDESIAPAVITISDVVMYKVNKVSLETVAGEYEITSANMGAKPWDVQKLQKVSIEAGHDYKFLFKASSTVPRKVVAGVQQTVDPWGQYVQSEVDLTEKLESYEVSFTAPVDDAEAGAYFNIGKWGEGETPESTITIEDVQFIDITAGNSTKVSYTSGRVNTQNKHAYTYGKFEVRAKVPVGKGYLPAFWLMANDENIYGQWPRCGEIDCMEVMGQDPTKLYGTIHFGNPHSESQGTYVTGEGEKSFSDDFHVFTCEWNPGEIIWYVDGTEFHRESRWYSTTEGQGTLTYPAPFDQPFYIILNLAIGGSWVGYPDENTSFDDNPYVIDYVRVYQKDSYDEDVEMPEITFNPRPADNAGNYIVNGDFATAEALDDKADWVFMTALEGVAEAAISDNKMNITTTAAGTVDYSVQLVQANIPFEKYATYEVKFDAYADTPRGMNVDVKAPDHGYKAYMTTLKPELTTTNQTFTQTFMMKDDSDENGRLEFNMGASSTAAIHISNVSVKKIKDADPDYKEKKTVLADGNYIYNGSFQEGKNHLGEWIVSVPSAVKVTDFEDGRRAEITAPADKEVILKQEELAFKAGTPYLFSFDLETKKETVVGVNIGSKGYLVPITPDKKSYSFKIPADAVFKNNDVELRFKPGSSVKLDNVKLAEYALIKNGSFNAGLTGYEIYVDSSASAEYVVDSLKEDNALSLTINKTGDADWKIQVKQNNVKLIKDHTYVLKASLKSTVERPIRVIMQGGESLGWPVYSHENQEMFGPDFVQIEDEFTMEADTDSAAFLSICLGNLGDGDYTDTKHEVVIDDISLVDITPDAGGEDDENLYESKDITDYVSIALTNPETVYTYTGSAFEPEITVDVKEGVNLTEGTDYEIVYKNNVNAGKNALAIVKGIYEYGGEVSVGFTINPIDASGFSVTPEKTAYTYTGSAITPAVTVKDATGNVIAEKNYTVNYVNNKEAGKATVEVTFKDNYAGTIKSTFTITPADASGFSVTPEKTAYTYTGSAITPAVTVKDAAGNVIAATNYTVNYANNKEAGKATAEVTFKDNYAGTIKSTFTITPADASGFSVTPEKTAYTYTGSAITPAVTVKDATGNVIAATNYTVNYANNKEVGTATIEVKFKDNYTGTIKSTFTIEKAPIVVTPSESVSIKTGKVKISSSVKYTGKVLKPQITLTVDGKTLKAGTDYTVKYSNNKKVGKAKVVITGKGNYKDSITKTFKIVPKPVTKLTAKAVKKGFKLSWQKGKATQVTGYQVRYATSKKALSKAKKKAIKSYKTNKKTVKKLKASKKYFVQVRAYKVVSGKKYYSAWTKAKAVTTKK